MKIKSVLFVAAVCVLAALTSCGGSILCRPVWASCRPGSAPLPRPGLRGGYTRVSSGFANGF